MSNETFFRMLSIAFLGAVALAFLPDSQADSAAMARLEASLDASDSAANFEVVGDALDAPSAQAALGDIVFDEDPMSIEIQNLRDIEEINAGRFNPAVAGDIASH